MRKILCLFVSAFVLLVSTVPTTFGYMVAETDSIVNTFTSSDAPAVDTVTVTVTVDKTVDNIGPVPIGPDGFEFTLQDLSGEYTASAVTDAEGVATFDLVFSSADADRVYTYTLSEVDGGLSGVTYDSAVYEIAVAVEHDESGALYAAVTVDGAAADACVASFRNVYNSADTVSPATRGGDDMLLWQYLLAVSGTAIAVWLWVDRRLAKQ